MSDAAKFLGAIRGGDAATVEAMLDADPALAGARNEQQQSPVLLAIYTNQAAIRDLLLARGVRLELHDAVAAGRLDRVKEFVERDRAAANGISPDGFPLVALAAFFGHEAVARYLAEKGADVNAAATNGSEYTALTGAVTSGHTEIVLWLLAAGAEVNYRYGPGYSPLLTAAANGRLAIVKLLLEHGADANAKTADGQTALSLAEARGHKEVVEYLHGRPASA